MSGTASSNCFSPTILRVNPNRFELKRNDQSAQLGLLTFTDMRLRLWLVAACMLLASASAGLTFSFEAQQGFVAGCVGAAVLLVALIVQIANPGLGFAVLIVTAAALPLEFRGPAQSVFSFPFVLAACLCFGWVVAVLVVNRQFALDASRVVYAALAFVTISLFSFLTGQYEWIATTGAPLGAQLGGLALFLLSAGLFLAVGHQVRNTLELKRLTWLFLAAGAVSCLANVFWVDFVSEWTRPESLGSLFWTWLVALSFSQALLNQDLSLPIRVSLFCLTATTLYRVLFQSFDWVSGWLPPLIALGVVLFFRLPRVTISLGLLTVPAGLFLAPTIWDSLMIHEQYSYMTRLEAWKTLWHVVVKSPLFGLGPANYHHYVSFFPVMGWYVKFNSHNGYLDLLAQLGLLGLFAFGWFTYEISRLSFRLQARLPEGFARAYVIGAIGGLAGSLIAGMLADWIIPFFYNIGIRGFRSSLLFWVFLGGVLALKRMLSRSGASTLPQFAPY